MDKSYRIHTNIIQDTLLQVNMKQDFDFLEVLSLKLRQKDAYRLHSSNYGVIVGRVLANDAFGIPNAKISVFIERDSNDSSEIENIYPYSEVTSKDKEGRRYNLLPDYSDDDCYKVVGTFPNKRLMLDEDVQLEVYDKYWKYTTVSNNSGDYMLFGVPTGSVTVHVDLDLSDIGVLSQKPRDFEYKGYNITMFDSPSQFKDSTNLDGLAQLFSQNRSVFVYPFWGDSNNGVAALTRADIQIQYKFEPTCVFMGSIVSDNEGHAIGHKCAPDVENGMNNQLVGGSGTIEMIRRTPDGLVEEYPIKGNQLIDENGVWCYQIPMNLDYIGMDEYGNIVPTDNASSGIPTRTQVRFRFSKNETNDEGFSRHTAKYLVPMNPIFDETKEIPHISDRGIEVEKMYNFGSTTPLHCFRDLYWNNVYSVKNYIPKTQVAHRITSKNYTALKGSNFADDQNPIPFNKMNINITFTYMIICIIYTIIVWIVWFINMILCAVLKIADFIDLLTKPFRKVTSWIPVVGTFTEKLELNGFLPDCISLSAGGDEGDDVYFLGCWCGSKHWGDCPDYMEDKKCTKHGGSGLFGDEDGKQELIDKVQRNLALEFKIVKLDFYQDWINGCLYMPLWYWRKRKKKSFLFGLITSRAKNEYCSDSTTYSRIRKIMTCNIEYRNNSLQTDNNAVLDRQTNWHKSSNASGEVRFKRGLIKPVENRDGLTAYYYAATQATIDNTNPSQELALRPKNFTAVRLYATDIILLGNLNPNNMYGIPQFFTCLPSTTANIPPIATIKANDGDEDRSNNDGTTPDETGSTLTTGMDWNHDGGEETPAYKTGLFMDLACTYARTRAKSCINVERLSELGVALDTRHKVSYRGNGINYANIDTDGFITKYELDDLENRAMFATMNHIGFIPQEYQNIHDYYSTQVYDSNTNYLIPKFKYMYPVDFDGRMQEPIEGYARNFDQQTYDVRDEAYITFRLGAESGTSKNNSEGRMRHFYHSNGTYRDMPLYNNSYYFYFGVKKGSTAIDKFNELFYSPCVRNEKKPFTLDVESRGRSYCPSAYNSSECTETYKITDNRNNAYGYIKVSSDDIRTPFSYTLKDSYGDVVISEIEMYDTTFVIGGKIDNEGNILCNCEGKILYQSGDEKGKQIDPSVTPYYTSGLTNQEYTLEITDADGKTLREKVKLAVPNIMGMYDKIDLGTKFYNNAETRIDYICHDRNKFYGEIIINGIVVDGYTCRITACDLKEKNNQRYRLCITAECDEISSGISAVLDLYSLDTENGNVRDCMCDIENSIASGQSAQETMSIDRAKEHRYYYGFQNNVIRFFVYQPNKYILKLTQICDGTCSDNPLKLIDNTSSDIIEVKNGEPFETYLNGMPTKFMIGTSSDNFNAVVAKNSHFYSGDHVGDTLDSHMIGWYGTHEESAYLFPPTTESNVKIWSNFIPNGIENIETINDKRKILKYKFEKMFSLSEAVYLTEASHKMFMYTSTGGVKPILYRSVVPIYTMLQNDTTVYVLNDLNRVTAINEYPNIVSYNYVHRQNNNSGPQFNVKYSWCDYAGNYFAAFTRDGGYTAKTPPVDSRIIVEKRPAFATVDPTMGAKIKGKDIKTNNYLAVFRSAFNKRKEIPSLPYLRAVNVDRRLDYDLVLFAPSLETNMTLESDELKDKLWKGGRISGTTFNGIEMAYDENYNIISPNSITTYHIVVTDDLEAFVEDYHTELPTVDDSIVFKTFNSANVSASTIVASIPVEETKEDKDNHRRENIAFGMVEAYGSESLGRPRTEYSYICNEGISDAVTLYNSGYTDCVWERDKEDKDVVKPLNKRFYSANINNADIRDYFWSTFNKDRLIQYASSITSGDIISGETTYVYKYPSRDTSLYNGSFDMETVATNYPMRRFIDVANLPTQQFYMFGITSCSYSMKPRIDDDDTIVCEVEEGDGIDIQTSFSTSIVFTMPNADSSDYSNVVYEHSGNGKSLTFFAKTIDMNFQYTLYDSGEFNVYTHPPRVIRVLPYTDDCNGISHYKLVNKTSNELVGFTQNLDDAISGVTIVDFNSITAGKTRWDEMFGIEGSGIKYPAGVNRYESTRIYHKNGVPLKSDDVDFANISFHFYYDGGNLGAFTVLTDRELITKEMDENAHYVEGDNLTRHIRLLETSQIFDCRHVELEIIDFKQESGETIGTYVVGRKIYDSPTEVVDKVTSDTGTVTTNTNNSSNDSTSDESGDEGGESGGDEGGGDEGGETSMTVVTSVSSHTTPVHDTQISITQTITFKLPIVTNGNINDRTNEAFGELGMMSYTLTFKNSGGEEFDVSPQTSISKDQSEKIDGIILVAKWSANMGILTDAQWGTYTECKLTARTSNNFVYLLDYFKFSSVSGKTAEDIRNMVIGSSGETVYDAVDITF